MADSATEEVILATAASFQKIDEDKKGRIARHDFALVMQMLDPELYTEPRIDEILKKFDPGNGDEIDYEAFVEWTFASDPTSPSRKAIRRGFEDHSKLCWTGLLMQFDAGNMPDPQIDLIGGIRLLSAQPEPADGFSAFEIAARRPTFAWTLGSGSSDEIATRRRRSKTKRGDENLQNLEFEPAFQMPTGDFTFGMWVRWLEIDNPTPVLRFHPELFMTLTKGGLCVTHDPYCRDATGLQVLQVARGTWMLLLMDFIGREKCHVMSAFDEHGMRRIGKLEIPLSCNELRGLGGGCQAGHVAQFIVWDRVLSKSDRLDCFLSGAQRYGCLVEAQAKALRMGKVVRAPSARAAFESAISRVHSDGIADFTGLNIVNDDLPEILEAISVGQPKALNLPGALIDEDGAQTLLEFLCQDPHAPSRVNLTGCLALSGIQEELLQRFPYHRGISLEAAESGLADEHVISLRNHSERAQMALQAAAKEKEQCDEMVAAFMSQQTALETIALEDGDAAEEILASEERVLASLEEEPCHVTGDSKSDNRDVRATVGSLSHPRRWRPGINALAVEEGRAYWDANPDGLVVIDYGRAADDDAEEDESDINGLGTRGTMKASSGEEIQISHIEYGMLESLAYRTIMSHFREVYTHDENLRVLHEYDEYEDGEYDAVPFEVDGVDAPEMRLLTTTFRKIDGSLEGGSRRYIGFMVWCGIRIDPSRVASEAARRATNQQMLRETGCPHWKWQQEVDVEVPPENLWTREKYNQHFQDTLARYADPRHREAWLAEQREKFEKRRLALEAERHRRDALTKAARQMYDKEPRPEHVASGQIIAHFTHICKNGKLLGDDVPIPHSYFQMMHLSETPRSPPRFGRDLHSALASNEAMIQQVIGTSFGKDSVRLTLQNRIDSDIDVVVRRGSIFQHVDWVHRQNLLVVSDVTLRVPAGGTLTKGINAYCMNSRCACASGNPLSLTEFYVDDVQILMSQMNVWNHFNACFYKPKTM